MQISQDLRDVLVQGYSAGGEPELAQQLANSLRIKDKLNQLLKTVQDDLSEIWRVLTVSGFYGYANYALLPNEPLKYAINSLIKNEPMTLALKPAKDSTLSATFRDANMMRKYLKNKLNAISVRLQYGGESEYFLVSASDTSNI